MKRKMMLLGALLASALPLWAALKVDPAFSSNMVLQQGRPIVFFGTADPGKEVAIEFAGKKNAVKADAKGNWKAVFPAMKADHVNYSAQFTSGKEKIEFKDVLLGEVWFCSGQSNMALRVGKTFKSGSTAMNCEEEVKNARYPEIRFACQRSVKGHQQLRPTAYSWQTPGTWVKCSPETVHYFSAVGYFFGRQLYKDLNVPVGLINSSWGGTRIQAWISQAGFREAGLTKEIEEYQAHDFNAAQKKEYETKKAAEYSAAMAGYLPVFEKAGAAAKSKAADWSKPDFDDGKWDAPVIGRSYGRHLVRWGRVRFTLPEKIQQPVKLAVNKPAEGGELYLNGKLIASFKASDPEKQKNLRLTLKAGELKTKGENVLAFRGQYFYPRETEGELRNLFVHSRLSCGKTVIPLKNWKMRDEFVYLPGQKGNKPAPAFLTIDYLTPQFPSTLYNGMVHGWTRFPIRGVIWYQGCSNSGQERYYLLQKALIADWRARWNDPQMPFLVTQLAGYEPAKAKNWMTADPNRPSGYALTRDLQFQAVKEVPNAGIACLIDIGEASNIHPANKQDVGKRLALEAERIAYGKKIVSRGPVFRKAVVDGSAIRVFFDNVPTTLETRDGKLPGAFAIAGADGKFVWAEAKIDGKESVVVSSAKVKSPKFVRYGYMGYRGDCNLINKEGLPAYPFRSDAIDYTKIK